MILTSEVATKSGQFLIKLLAISKNMKIQLVRERLLGPMTVTFQKLLLKKRIVIKMNTFCSHKQHCRVELEVRLGRGK
jgi:hypothetical protein